MKKHKTAQAAKSKKKRPLPKRLILVLLAVILGVIFAGAAALRILENSSYFKIRDVVLRCDEGLDLSYLKGRNIFALNLRKEAGYIQGFYPDYKAVKLVRVFPDRLFVYFLKRKPVAVLKLYRDFLMDKEGVLCNPSAEEQGPHLPVVVGLETRIFGPSAGKKYRLKETELVLEIIREFERNRALKGYSIKKIDVTRPSDTSIFLLFPAESSDFSGDNNRGIAYGGLEVKLGEGNIGRKVAILGGVIKRGREGLAGIRYIDLRFNKPVVKYK